MRQNAMPIIETWVGADGRTLTFNCKSDGSAYDLTGLTLYLSARIGGPDGDVVIDNKEMTVTDEAGGVATYTPTLVELALAVDPMLMAQITIKDGGGLYDFSEMFGIQARTPIVGSS